MSIISGLPPQLQEKNHKKLFHQRHDIYDSGELDVFEATRYFSGATDISGPNFMPQQTMRSGGRISLDMINPMFSSSSSSSTSRSSSIPTQNYHHHHQQQNVFHKATKEGNIKKCKQPNSPGGRIASFFNSLFTSQISSKKKTSWKSSTSTHSLKDEDESPTGRRKRRSSISHFPVIITTKISVDSKSSIYISSSSSGFRTPPPYSTNSPKNNSSLKDLRSCNSDHEKPVATNNLSKISYGDHVTSATSTTSTSTASEKVKDFDNGLSSSDLHYIKFTNDDGADSDSSSDLFELPNYDLSGLPVYETTHMDNIKRGAPITSATIQVTQRL